MEQWLLVHVYIFKTIVNYSVNDCNDDGSFEIEW